MKIPGLGEVKTPYVVGGGAFLVGVLGYAYWRNKKRQASAAAAAAAAPASGTQDGTGAGSSGIDPSTGIPYADEVGSYGSTYGGIDPATGIPYYDEITQSSTTGSSNSITTNAQWIQQAESDAQNLFGYTSAVATSAVGKFISQTNAGLQPNEYQLMQSVIADLGQPPTGGPYRLIQAPGSVSGGNPPSGGGTTGATKSITPGEVLQIPVLASSHGGMQGTATFFDISLQHLINNNPGSSASYQGVVNIPYLVHQGDTLDSIAKRFGISAEHLAQDLATEGII